MENDISPPPKNMSFMPRETEVEFLHSRREMGIQIEI